MNVEWIKIQTDMFQNRKIRYIEVLPQGDAMLVIWCKLLCLAGQVNDYGRVYVTPLTPYTTKALAIELNKDESIVERALDVFLSLGMIEFDRGVIIISKWGEYQNLDGLEKIKEQNRARKQRQRERKKEAEESAEPVEEEVPDKPKKRKEDIKHKYGTFNNVLLTDDEYKKLQDKFTDLGERIERLSLYISSSGKSYKSHYATILSWAKKDETEKPKNDYYKEKQKQSFYSESRGTDYDKLFGGGT